MRGLGDDDRQEPVRIAKGDEAPGPWQVAGVGVKPCVGLRIAQRQGERFPFALVDSSMEHGRGTQVGHLVSQVVPERPGAIGVMAHEFRRVLVIACARIGSHGSEGQKRYVVRPQVDPELRRTLAAMQGDQAPLSALQDEIRVFYCNTALKTHARTAQPLHHGCDDHVVLVPDRAPDPCQVVNARQFLQETQQVALEFDRTVPVLEGERGLPECPEVGREEMRGEAGLDPFAVKVTFGSDQKAREFQPVAHLQAQIAGIDDLALTVDESPRRIRAQKAVGRPQLFLDGARRILCGGDRVEDVPETDVALLREHAPAARHMALDGVAGRVEGTCRVLEFLEDLDVGTRHARIADQEHGSREAGDAASDQIGPAGVAAQQCRAPFRVCMHVRSLPRSRHKSRLARPSLARALGRGVDEGQARACTARGALSAAVSAVSAVLPLALRSRIDRARPCEGAQPTCRSAQPSYWRWLWQSGSRATPWQGAYGVCIGVGSGARGETCIQTRVELRIEPRWNGHNEYRPRIPSEAADAPPWDSLELGQHGPWAKAYC